MSAASAELSKRHAWALDAYHEPGASRDVVPQQPGLIIAVDDFFSEAECEALIGAAHVANLQPPSAADLMPKKNEAYLNRESKRKDGSNSKDQQYSLQFEDQIRTEWIQTCRWQRCG